MILLATIGSELTLTGDIATTAVGSARTYTLTARGGVPPYTIGVQSETFPAEWTIADQGDGTVDISTAEALTAGNFSVTFLLTDSLRNDALITRRFRVAPLALTLTGSLTDAEELDPYSASLTRTGGVGDITITAQSGFPTSLTAAADNPNNQVDITGTPASGTAASSPYSPSVSIEDEEGNTATWNGSLVVVEGGPSDPYFANVVALLHFDGADASTTFTDVIGKTWTAGGNAQIDTAQSKFGGASGLFDGSGDSVSTPDSADFAFGAGDFTIEAWVRVPNVTGTKVVACQWGAAGQRSWIMQVVNSSLQFVASAAGTSPSVTIGTPGASLSSNTWHHLAVTRNGSTWKAFVDGVAATQTASFTMHNSTDGCYIGTQTNGSTSPFNGHIDDLRITKGVARYTSDFTPPTEAFPDE